MAARLPSYVPPKGTRYFCQFNQILCWSTEFVRYILIKPDKLVTGIRVGNMFHIRKPSLQKTEFKDFGHASSGPYLVECQMLLFIVTVR